MPVIKSPTTLTRLRNAFVTGLVLLSPLAVTWLVFSWLVGKVGGTFEPVFFSFVPDELRQNLGLLWDFLATVLVLVFITGLGILSRYVFGRFFVGVAERLITGIPGVSTVYNTVKQIVDTISAQNRTLFSKVVMVEYPRKGVWSLAFLTNKTQGEPQALTSSENWTVFVPTTPNPTSGFLLLVPSNEIIELSMTVGEGMKFVVSGGSVVPPWPRKTTPPAPPLPPDEQPA